MEKKLRTKKQFLSLFPLVKSSRLFRGQKLIQFSIILSYPESVLYLTLRRLVKCTELIARLFFSYQLQFIDRFVGWVSLVFSLFCRRLWASCIVVPLKANILLFVVPLELKISYFFLFGFGEDYLNYQSHNSSLGSMWVWLFWTRSFFPPSMFFSVPNTWKFRSIRSLSSKTWSTPVSFLVFSCWAVYSANFRGLLRFAKFYRVNFRCS